MATLQFALALLVAILGVTVHTLPLDPRNKGPPDPRERPVPVVDANGQPILRKPRIPDTPGLNQDEYERYWGEMIKDDPALLENLKKMNNLDPELLAKLHPKVSERMARTSDGVRNRLEEARRMNMDELRELQRFQQELEEKNRRFSPDSEWVAMHQALRDNLPQNFDKDDVQRRMAEQRRVLEDIDRRRREEFEQYQLQLEHQRREKLKQMNEQQRLRAEKDLQDYREKQQHHEKMKMPVSKDQLEEVWEEDDGLKDEQFDPKTFFFLHDTNGDRILDPMELQALFYNEVKKAYGKNIDNMQLQEEMARMREYALKQLDKNGDAVITLQEFLSYTQGEKFGDKDEEEWKGVVDQPESFTEEEMKKYEDDYEDYYDYEYDEEGNIVGFKTRPPHGTEPVDQQDQQPPNGVVGDQGKDQGHIPPAPTDGDTNQQQQQQQQQRGAQNEEVPDQQQQEQQQQQQQQQQQVEHQQGQEERVPAEKETQEESLPGQEQLHIQPAGTQRDGQAQQFQKNHEPDAHQQ